MATLMLSIVSKVVESVAPFSTVEQIEILTCVINSLKAIRNSLVIFNAHWHDTWDEGEDDAQD